MIIEQHTPAEFAVPEKTLQQLFGDAAKDPVKEPVANKPMERSGGDMTLVDPQGKWTITVTKPEFNKETGKTESNITMDQGFTSDDKEPMRMRQNFSTSWSREALDEQGNLKEEVFASLESLADGINDHYEQFFGQHDRKELEYYSTRPGVMGARDTTVIDGMKNGLGSMLNEISPVTDADGFSASTLYDPFPAKEALAPEVMAPAPKVNPLEGIKW